MNDKPIEIPRRIGEPPHVLLWSADEFLPIFIGLAFGMPFRQAFIGTLVGFAISRLYSRYRDNRPDGYPLHLARKYGLFTASKSRSMRMTLERTYIA